MSSASHWIPRDECVGENLRRWRRGMKGARVIGAGQRISRVPAGKLHKCESWLQTSLRRKKLAPAATTAAARSESCPTIDLVKQEFCYLGGQSIVISVKLTRAYVATVHQQFIQLQILLLVSTLESLLKRLKSGSPKLLEAVGSIDFSTQRRGA